MPPRMPTDDDYRELLFANVETVPFSGCWVWMKSLFKNGYAAVSYRATMAYGHRLSYQLFKGDIPDGLDLDHLCRVRCCINPDHLEPVTRGENLRRGDMGGNGKQRGKKFCKRGHEFTPENTRISYRKNNYGDVLKSRRCLKCQAVSRRRRYTEKGK